MLKFKKLKLLLVALSVLLLVVAFISGCGKDDAKPQMATQPAQTAQTDQSPVQEQQQPSRPEQNTPPEKTTAQHEALPEDSAAIQQPPQNTSSDEEINDSANAGVAFPAFTLTDLNGREVNSKDLLSNKLTLINIWSTT